MPTTGDPQYLALLEEMGDLHKRKMAGYTGDDPDPWRNFRSSEKLGVDAFTGCLVRLSDKFLRIQSLVANPVHEQVGEALEDTLKDLAAYSLIGVCLLREKDVVTRAQEILLGSDYNNYLNNEPESISNTQPMVDRASPNQTVVLIDGKWYLLARSGHGMPQDEAYAKLIPMDR